MPARAGAVLEEQHDPVQHGKGRKGCEVVLPEKRRLPSAAAGDELDDADDVGDERERSSTSTRLRSHHALRSERNAPRPSTAELDELTAATSAGRAVRGSRHDDEQAEGGRRREQQAQREIPPRAEQDDDADREERREQRCPQGRSRPLCRRCGPRHPAGCPSGSGRAPTVRRNSAMVGERSRRQRAICRTAATAPYDSPMRVVFLTGIWPPDIGGPGDARPGLRALPPRSRSPRRGCDDVRRRADGPARPGAHRCARTSVRRSLSARRTHRRAARAARRPRLRHRDLRRRRDRIRGRAPSARREARSPTRPTSGRAATGSSPGSLEAFQAHNGRPGRRAEAAAHAVAPPCSTGRRAEPLPRGCRGRLGARAGADRGARQPCAASGRRARRHRLRRTPSSSSAGSPSRRRCPCCSTRSASSTERRSRSSATVPSGRRSNGASARTARGSRSLQRRPPARPGAGASRRSPCGGALERVGEPAARGRRGARRRHAGRLDSGRGRARGRGRWRERPARPAERRTARSPPRCDRSWSTTNCAPGWRRLRSRRWRRSDATRSTHGWKRSSWRLRADAARALRRARTPRASARAVAAGEVGRALRRARAARPERGIRRRRRSVPPPARARQRLLPAPALRGRGGAPAVPRRRDRRLRSVRRRRGARRPSARAFAREAHRRGARRPATFTRSYGSSARRVVSPLADRQRARGSPARTRHARSRRSRRRSSRTCAVSPRRRRSPRTAI